MSTGCSRCAPAAAWLRNYLTSGMNSMCVLHSSVLLPSRPFVRSAALATGVKPRLSLTTSQKCYTAARGPLHVQTAEPLLTPSIPHDTAASCGPRRLELGGDRMLPGNRCQLRRWACDRPVVWLLLVVVHEIIPQVDLVRRIHDAAALGPGPNHPRSSGSSGSLPSK